MPRQLLLISVLLLTMYISSYGQNFPGAKPKGKIRSMVMLRYNTKDSSNFNRKGQMTDGYHYGYPGYNGVYRDTSKTINVYNKMGQLSKLILYAKKGQLIINYSYFKTDSGLIQRRDEIGMGEDKPWGFTDKRFNKSGKIVQTKLNAPDSIGGNEFNYKYNKNGYLMEYVYTNKKRTSKTSYEYNEDGDVIAEQIEDRTGIARYKYKYTKYDELHNWLVQYSAADFSKKIERRITYYK